MKHLTKSPCKDCTKRSIDPPCHGRCKEYLEYQRDVEIIRAARAKNNEEHNTYVQMIIKNADRRK